MKIKEKIISKIESIKYKLKNNIKLSKLEKIIVITLKVISTIYYFLNITKWFLYKKNILKSYKSSNFTISIGNIKVGGTGKSPFTIWLATRLLNLGFDVAVINRGYLGPTKKLNIISDGVKLKKDIKFSSDEAYMEALALIGGSSIDKKVKINENILNTSQYFLSFAENKVISQKGAFVLTAKERIDAIKYLENMKFSGINILDDAFQYYRLIKDFEIVLIDYYDPFSNGWQFPFGLLRDRLEHLKDADIIIITKCPNSFDDDVKKKLLKIEDICIKYGFKGKFFYSHIIINNLYLHNHNKIYDFSVLKNDSVLIISALGNNNLFLKQVIDVLSCYNVNIFTQSFYDHYHFPIDIQINLAHQMKKLKIKNLITTFKDVIKLKKSVFKDFNVYSVMFDLNINNSEDLVKTILQKYYVNNKK